MMSTKIGGAMETIYILGDAILLCLKADQVSWWKH